MKRLGFCCVQSDKWQVAGVTGNAGTQRGTSVGPAVARLTVPGYRTHAASRLSSGTTCTLAKGTTFFSPYKELIMKTRYLLFAGLLWAQAMHAAERFEAAALVDSLDFAACKDKSGNYLFDTEMPEGNRAVLDHVLLTGANTILWRNCVGGTMRYQSSETKQPWVESPLDKRRLPDNRPIYGWLRYYQSDPDILRDMLDVCHERDLQAGVHWPFEETHWHSWTIGPFNLEHPEYWAASAGGSIWAGRCSLAYPEVVEHKLRLVDELVERGMDHLFIDLCRTGAWGPPDEFVQSEIERWRKQYGTEPPKDGRDVRWCEFVAETTHAYFVSLRKRLNAKDRKIRLMAGILGADIASDKPDVTLTTRGTDWRRLVEEGIIDTLVVMSVKWDTERPFESTREIYRSVLDTCDGRCEVLFPVSMYNFSNKGVPGYQKATKLPADKIAGELVKIAWEEGGDGICLECVDYNNYSAKTRAVLRDRLEKDCRFKRETTKSLDGL